MDSNFPQDGKQAGLRILDTDVTPNGLIITFSDGLAVLYHTQFLYDMRDHDHNIPLTKPRRKGMPLL